MFYSCDQVSSALPRNPWPIARLGYRQYATIGEVFEMTRPGEKS
jgi:hypothetical protein